MSRAEIITTSISRCGCWVIFIGAMVIWDVFRGIDTYMKNLIIIIIESALIEFCIVFNEIIFISIKFNSILFDLLIFFNYKHFFIKFESAIIILLKFQNPISYNSN